MPLVTKNMVMASLGTQSDIFWCVCRFSIVQLFTSVDSLVSQK